VIERLNIMPGRRLLATTLTFLIAVISSAFGQVDSAHASSGYKFWNYFHGHGSTWQFAETGAASYVPGDGSVEGWRYGISDGVHGRQPRTVPNFGAVCADSPAGSGEKRVAVVIDYGVSEEAPEGETPPEPVGACAVVPTEFNGEQVLQSVAAVRIDAMVCGISGYPATGCAAPSREANVQHEPTVRLQMVHRAGGSRTASGGFSGQLVALAALVVAIGVGAVTLTMRRRG
jgi:hypothetical protein